MGYPTKIQQVKRGEAGDQWYVNLPTVLAHAMDFQKSETVEWTLQDKNTLILRRRKGEPSARKRRP